MVCREMACQLKAAFSMSICSAAESIRRSGRARKTRSALELLGIERKRTGILHGETDVEHSQLPIIDFSEPCRLDDKPNQRCPRRVWFHLSHCQNDVRHRALASTVLSGEHSIVGVVSCSRSSKSDRETDASDGRKEVLDDLVQECPKNVDAGNPLGVLDPIVDSFGVPTTILNEASGSHANEVSSSSLSPSSTLLCCQINEEDIADQKQHAHQTILVDTAYFEQTNETMQSYVVEDRITPVTSEDLNKLLRNKSGRAVPVRHVVMGDELQRIVDNLQPKDIIDDHVIYRVRKEGGKRRLMFCKYCEVQINHRHQFRSHIKSHREVDYRPYHCPLCNYKSQIKAQIARHINIHSTSKPYFCTECGREFNFKQKLQIHMKYHADIRDQTCPLCQVSFHEFKTLKNHVRSVHNIANPKEFLRRRLTSLRDERGKFVNDSGSEDIMKLSKKRTVSNVGVTSERSSLLQVSPADGAVFHCVEAESAANEGKTGSFGVKKSLSVELPSNVKREVDHSVSSAVCDISSCVNRYEPPETLMDDLQPKLLRNRRKSTIYGTCKTNIQTEMYRRRLSSTGSSLHGKVRKLVQKSRALGISQKRKPNSRVFESLKVYCNSVAIRHPDYPDHDVLLSCNLCSAVGATSVFPTRTLLARHLENNHPNLKAWQCDQCSFRCRLRSRLIAHVKSHFEYNKQMCEFCGEIFICKQKLMVHLRQHLKQREFKCNSCLETFSEQSQLRRHISLVHCEGRPYSCNVCNKTYEEEMQFRRHLEMHDDRKFQCDTCKKLYKNRLSLALHLKSHSCVFRCQVCGKEFGSYSGFMSHKIMHIESHNGYQCEKCSKRLNTKGSMSRHYKIVHGSERPFACKQCPKMFKTKRNLESHGVVHNPVKRFVCTTCSYQCKRLHSLRVHMRVHFAVKPYHCVLCQRQYTQKQPLDIHIGRHISKPTSCVTCGISLSSGVDVIVHLRTVHDHVVDLPPPQPISFPEQGLSVDGASHQLVASSFDNSAHVQEEEVAAFESYGTFETIPILNTATVSEELRDED